jgi:pyruvate dehydrogenase E2 component (dihydrolipoamide acetyltransferase)
VALQEVVVPQMGEGLQEVCILQFHKKPGDPVRRDEPLYSMETDKATMEVESPYEGVLQEWLTKEGDVIPIGAAVARLEVVEVAVLPAPQMRRAGLVIPPRTRAYCKEKGVSESEMLQIPAASGKLMPADVDNYLAAKLATIPESAAALEEDAPAYIERPMTTLQRVFNYRLKRSAQLVIPAVIKRPLEWTPIRRFADAYKERGGNVQPSAFQTFAYCLAQAVREHPRLRSALIGEDVIREYAHLNIGIAVGLPDGQLTTAVVNNADTLSYEDFVRAAQTQIQRAREGEDQAGETVQILLTYMGPYDVHDAIPVLVAPAVAVLFIGSTYERNGELLVNLVMTFDHRLIQGIEAAEFLKKVAVKVQQVAEIAG